jgi:hypothetical protein
VHQDCFRLIISLMSDEHGIDVFGKGGCGKKGVARSSCLGWCCSRWQVGTSDNCPDTPGRRSSSDKFGVSRRLSPTQTVIEMRHNWGWAASTVQCAEHVQQGK